MNYQATIYKRSHWQWLQIPPQLSFDWVMLCHVMRKTYVDKKIKRYSSQAEDLPQTSPASPKCVVSYCCWLLVVDCWLLLVACVVSSLLVLCFFSLFCLVLLCLLFGGRFHSEFLLSQGTQSAVVPQCPGSPVQVLEIGALQPESCQASLEMEVRGRCPWQFLQSLPSLKLTTHPRN